MADDTGYAGSSLAGGLPNTPNTPNLGGGAISSPTAHGGPHGMPHNPYGDHPYDLEIPNISMPEGTATGSGYVGGQGQDPWLSWMGLMGNAPQPAPQAAPQAASPTQSQTSSGNGMADLYGYLALLGGMNPYLYSALVGGLGAGYTPSAQ